MSPGRNPGRTAGLLYLLLALLAPVRLGYIPGKLFVPGDAAATAQNITAHELLFRFGIVCDLATGTILIFLLLALYRLFKDYDRNLAVLMVLLGGVLPSAIYFVNVLNDAAALVILHGDRFLSVFSKPQRDALLSSFACTRRRSSPPKPSGACGSSPSPPSPTSRASCHAFSPTGSSSTASPT